ncbi:cupin domain-containing protein [Undibacterium parvum]|uniref:Cupin domain-containing protein n=2 Tax=Undibacterium TaxID=401469 RepID=A0A6M4A8B2_9BURK|nr:hypothetical protein [Undibacterium parvum]AZP13341.1 hypothetical protein EJN92_15880 [Undibacterium parvum]QJQ07403.1 hypothetical protein EJG51_018090 [Undibacterium piscinae]
MTTPSILTWSEADSGALTEAAIRAHHQPEENFKLYVNAYEAAQQFAVKAGHEFFLYVVTGACKTSVDGHELRLAAGQFVSLAAGSYAFEALGTEALQLVKVFARA